MEYRVFGGITVLNGGDQLSIGGAKPRRILGLLLVQDGGRVSTETIIDVLWPERNDEERLVNNVRTYVSRLRTSLGDDCQRVITVEGGYRLDLDGCQVDAHEFSRLIASADAAPPSVAMGCLDKALALFARGRPYGDFADEGWAQPEVGRLEELRLRALEQRAEARLASGAHADLVAELNPLVAEYPLRESFWRLLMLALYRSGRQAEALRADSDYREYLAQETGLEPTKEMRDLDSRIARSDTTLASAATGVTVRGYQLGEKIGEGGFGSIYRATQPAVGREVAIKLIRPEHADDPDFIRRFEFEAQLVARLEHPHVVPLYDYWREPGAAYLVMRWIRGGSLAQLLQTAPFDLAQTVQLVTQIGGALASAHEAGIVHRDVKPGNILIDERGDAYLTDFGIAVDDARTEYTLVSSAGSPLYVSPEQVLSQEVGPRSDIYSLGVVVYEALTGRSPFDSTSIRELYEEKARRAVGGIRELRRGIPEAVDRVVVQATSPDPAERPATILQFVAQFTQAATGITDSERPADGHRPVTATALSLGGGAVNPYRGLRAFREADSAFFFGRDALTAELVERLQHTRFLSIVGPSGAGKSSVVRAALTPAVRAGCIPGSDQWFVVTIIPGAHPFEELEAGLLRVAVNPPRDLLEVLSEAPRGIARAVKQILPADDDSELLLVVDQFEELFTLTDPAHRDAFLSSLVAAVTEQGSRLRVVTTLRADFFDRPLAHQTVGEITRANTVAIAPLSPEGLERAIAGPAERVGVSLEPSLIAQIVSDVADNPGSLPLLQYTLTELFDRRVRSTLGLDSYDAIGGLSGSLAGRADEIFEALDPEGQLATRRLFGRLVTPGAGAEDTRRRARRSELATVPEAVIDAFGNARLLSFDRDPSSREPTVEVAHETLISRWPRLRAWVDEDRESLRLLRHLADAARAWDAGDRDPGELYRGTRLQTAEEWAAANPGALAGAEQDFLDASLALRDAQLEAERSRIAEQARQNRRLRRMVVGITAVLVCTVVIGLFAVQQRQRAADEAEQANAARSAGETRRLVADAPSLVDSNRRVALLLAAEAYRRDPSPEALGALQQVLTRSGGLLGYLGADREYLEVAWTDGGERLVARRGDGLDVFDVGSGERILEIEAAPGDRIAVSPDGGLIAVTMAGSDLGDVVLYDGTTGGERVRLPQHSVVQALAISPDGGAIAVGGRDGTLRLFDSSSGREIFTVSAHPERDFPEGSETVSHEPAAYPLGVQAIAFSSDDSVVGTAGGVFVRTWSIASGAAIHGLATTVPRGADDRGPGRPTTLRLDDDGVMATTVSGRFLQIWDLSAGVTVAEHELEVSLVAAAQSLWGGSSLEGSSLLVSEGDTVFIVDRATGERKTQAIVLQAGSEGTALLAPDEKTIAAPGPSGIVLWAIDGRDLLSRRVDHRVPASGAVFIDKEGLLLAVNNGIANRLPAFVLDLTTESPVTHDFAERFLRIFFHRVGPIAQDFDAGVFVLDPESLAVATELPQANIYGAATSPDGSFIAIGTGLPDQPLVRIIDGETGAELIPPIEDLVPDAEEEDAVTSVAFSPDGARLAVASGSGLAMVLDTATWKPVGPRLSQGQGGVVGVAFSPDGRYLATLSEGGDITLRDASTYQPVGPPLVGGTGSSELWAGQVLVFSPDSRYLISTADRSARIWDVEHRVLIGSPIEAATGRSVSVSINGRWLAQPLEQSIAVTEIAPDRWFAIACRAAGRNLTVDEWTQFGPTDTEPQPTCPDWPPPAPTEGA